jgi:NADH:ubiquinone oxidoreductase subunit 3 (subunit A)
MPQSHDKELISHYECGFIPFDNARKPFEVKFYLVAILFLIFDLEITFLFPLGIIIKEISNISILSLTFFFVVLTIGFYFEWLYKGLDWNIKEEYNETTR